MSKATSDVTSLWLPRNAEFDNNSGVAYLTISPEVIKSEMLVIKHDKRALDGGPKSRKP